MSKKPKVLYFAVECKPFAKEGGVGDVAGELPAVLKKQGVDIEIVTPYYGRMDPKYAREKILGYKVDYNGQREDVEAYAGELDGVKVNFIKSPNYFEGDYSKVYIDSPHIPFWDDAMRFCFFSAACLELIAHKNPDIVHVNDWVLGYLLGFLEMAGAPQKKVLTIHNIGYQGSIHKDHVRHLTMGQLMRHPVTGPYFEMGPDTNSLKLGMELADLTNTVSPNYTLEIIRPENRDAFFEGGKGLHEIARRLYGQKRLIGILNGFDYKFDPSDDAFMAIMEEKKRAKNSLGKYFAKPDHFLVGFVGRAVEQKFRLLHEYIDGKSVLEHLLDIPDLNVAVLATGQRAYEALMNNLTVERFDGSMNYDRFLAVGRRKNYLPIIAFDKDMAVTISKASDLFLMPSLYEPCGITQLESMYNATPPLVRWTGGLTDAVISQNGASGTGFGFDSSNREELLWGAVDAVREAQRMYRKDLVGYLALQKRAFYSRFTWANAAKRYIKEVYKKVL